MTSYVYPPGIHIERLELVRSVYQVPVISVWRYISDRRRICAPKYIYVRSPIAPLSSVCSPCSLRFGVHVLTQRMPDTAVFWHILLLVQAWSVVYLTEAGSFRALPIGTYPQNFSRIKYQPKSKGIRDEPISRHRIDSSLVDGRPSCETDCLHRRGC